MARINFVDGDNSSIGAAQRYAKNMPIQGTSADILKRALRLLHDDIRETSAQLVNIVHDEIVVECDAADADATAAPSNPPCSVPASSSSDRSHQSRRPHCG